MVLLESFEGFSSLSAHYSCSMREFNVTPAYCSYYHHYYNYYYIINYFIYFFDGVCACALVGKNQICPAQCIWVEECPALG